MEILYVVDELGYADHIAVAYLSGVSKELGHQSHFCSIDRTNLSDKVVEIKPDVVAYSFHNSGFDDIVSSHNSAKEKHNFVFSGLSPDKKLPEIFEFNKQ